MCKQNAREKTQIKRKSSISARLVTIANSMAEIGEKMRYIQNHIKRSFAMQTIDTLEIGTISG